VTGELVCELFQPVTDVLAELFLFFQPFLAIRAKLLAEVVTLVLACVLHLFAEIFLSFQECVAFGIKLLNQGFDVIGQNRPIAFGLVLKAANACRDVFSLPGAVFVRVVRWGNWRYGRRCWRHGWNHIGGRNYVSGRRNRGRSNISRYRRERWHFGGVVCQGTDGRERNSESR
jgi:hypothetical protein